MQLDNFTKVADVFVGIQRSHIQLIHCTYLLKENKMFRIYGYGSKYIFRCYQIYSKSIIPDQNFNCSQPSSGCISWTEILVFHIQYPKDDVSFYFQKIDEQLLFSYWTFCIDRVDYRLWVGRIGCFTPPSTATCTAFCTSP